jgi:glycosyltransferase involved in cell wall biosynthesis
MDKKAPKVSIIMPTYNRAGYILETIESILRQTYSNWELIIIDDGSEDNTEVLVGQVKDERVRFYKAGRIGLNGKIKNMGLEKACGELIAFIDSDDFWSPVKIEKQVAALDQYPEAGFSLTGGYNFRNPDEPVEFFYKQSEGIKCENGFISFFRSEVAAFTQTLLFRRRCIDSTGFFSETKPFTDAEFILALAWHFKMVLLYEPLLYRRLHDSNYSSSNWLKAYYQGIEMIRSCRDKKMLPAAIARDALFSLYVNFGEDCLLHEEKRKAVSNFFNAWKNKPFSVIPFKKTGKAVLSYLKK